MKTNIYVDGFNLYYRMLKGAPKYKWVNPLRLAAKVLDPANKINKVWYFTAHVSARVDHDAPARQQTYLAALETVPEIQPKFGNFLVKKTWAGLVPPDLDPSKVRAKPPFLPWPEVVRIYRTEEKGSDVNLATQLLIDSFKDHYEVAAVITNDTDLVEPIRFVTQEMKKVVGILTPVPNPAKSLAAVASFVHHIRESHLAASQFPEQITLKNGRVIRRPETWV